MGLLSRSTTTKSPALPRAICGKGVIKSMVMLAHFCNGGFQRLQETKRFLSAVLGSLTDVTGLYIVFYCGFEGFPMVRCG
jgi:hypothetical protein